MAIQAEIKGTKFGVGDNVRVIQNIVEGDKRRTQAFEGMVIGIKGHGNGKSFTVRRIGTAQIGIERIFPFNSPTVESIEVIRSGVKGSRHAKLYYTRDKSKKEIETIYSRAARRVEAKGSEKNKKSAKKVKTKIKSNKTSKAKK